MAHQHPPATHVKFRSSCDACLRTKVKCSQTKPSCARCLRHGHKCVYSQYRKIGRPALKAAAAASGAVSAAATTTGTAGPTSSAVPLLPVQSPGKQRHWQQRQQQQRRLPQRPHRTATQTEPAVAADYRSLAENQSPRQDMQTPPQARPLAQHHAPDHADNTLIVTPPPQTFHTDDVYVGDAAALGGDAAMAMGMGGRIDYGMGPMDWSDLDSMLDFSVAGGGGENTTITTAHPSCPLPMDDMFVLDAANPIRLSPATISYGGDGLDVPAAARHTWPSSSPLSDGLSSTRGEGRRVRSHPRHGNATSKASPCDALASSSPAPEPQPAVDGPWPPRTRRPSSKALPPPTTIATADLSRTNFFRAREPAPATTTKTSLSAAGRSGTSGGGGGGGSGGSGGTSRCRRRCHVDLTKQLACISECQSRHDDGVPGGHLSSSSSSSSAATLDTLLALDHRVRATRAAVIRCPVCVGRGRCGQTLLLLTMVVSNLLGLFESGCAPTTAITATTATMSNDKSNDVSCSTSTNTSSLRGSCHSSRSSWCDSALGTFASSSSSSSSSSLSSFATTSLSVGTGDSSSYNSHHSHNAPPPPPPQPPPPPPPPSGLRLGLRTPCPLAVGDVRLSTTVQRAFGRRLLRLYLDRQRDALVQLAQVQAQAGSEASSEAGSEDVNDKLTRKLLEDVRRRVERLCGYLALTEGEKPDAGPDTEPAGRILVCARLDVDASHG